MTAAAERKFQIVVDGRKVSMTLAEYRAHLDRAKVRAMDNFERDWGTRDVRKVADALRSTIPGSSSPSDAAARALADLRA